MASRYLQGRKRKRTILISRNVVSNRLEGLIHYIIFMQSYVFETIDKETDLVVAICKYIVHDEYEASVDGQDRTGWDWMDR